MQIRTSPPNADSTGLWPVSCGSDHADLRRDVLFWSTLLAGAEKIHRAGRYLNKKNHGVPRYKTRAATVPSNSSRLSFIDEQTPSPPLDPRATQRPLWNEDKKCRDRQRFPEKSLIWQAQDASVLKVRYGNGRISPGDG